MNTILAIVGGIIAALSAAIVVLFNKNQNNNALIKNIDTKNQVDQDNANIIVDQAALDAEAAKRQQIQNTPVTPLNAQQLLDELNKDLSK